MFHTIDSFDSCIFIDNVSYSVTKRPNLSREESVKLKGHFGLKSPKGSHFDFIDNGRGKFDENK